LDLSSVALTFAAVDFELKESSPLRVYTFNEDAVSEQIDLITAFEHNPDDKDEIFAEWLFEHYFADSAISELLNDAVPISQYSIVGYDYNFTNKSSIPVNFKIDMQRFGNGEIALAVFWSVDSGDKAGILAYNEPGKFYYVQEAIPKGEDFTISFMTILLDDGSGHLAFVSELAELVQATNNAIYLKEDWKSIADNIIPYIETITEK
jgi:hypothetical protein